MMGSEDRFSIPRSNLQLLEYNEISSDAYSKYKVIVDLSDAFILFRRMIEKVSNRIPENYDIEVEKLNEWSIENLIVPNNYISLFKFIIEAIIKNCKESIPLPEYFVDIAACELETFYDNLMVGSQLYEISDELTNLLIGIYNMLAVNVLADITTYSPYHWVDTNSRLTLTFVRNGVKRMSA